MSTSFADLSPEILHLIIVLDPKPWVLVNRTTSNIARDPSLRVKFVEDASELNSYNGVRSIIYNRRFMNLEFLTAYQRLVAQDLWKINQYMFLGHCIEKRTIVEVDFILDHLVEDKSGLLSDGGFMFLYEHAMHQKYVDVPESLFSMLDRKLVAGEQVGSMLRTLSAHLKYQPWGDSAFRELFTDDAERRRHWETFIRRLLLDDPRIQIHVPELSGPLVDAVRAWDSGSDKPWPVFSVFLYLLHASMSPDLRNMHWNDWSQSLTRWFSTPARPLLFYTFTESPAKFTIIFTNLFDNLMHDPELSLEALTLFEQAYAAHLDWTPHIPPCMAATVSDLPDLGKGRPQKPYARPHRPYLLSVAHMFARHNQLDIQDWRPALCLAAHAGWDELIDWFLDTQHVPTQLARDVLVHAIHGAQPSIVHRVLPHVAGDLFSPPVDLEEEDGRLCADIWRKWGRRRAVRFDAERGVRIVRGYQGVEMTMERDIRACAEVVARYAAERHWTKTGLVEVVDF